MLTQATAGKPIPRLNHGKAERAYLASKLANLICKIVGATGCEAILSGAIAAANMRMVDESQDIGVIYLTKDIKTFLPFLTLSTPRVSVVPV
jgi:hypothetical protein